MLSPLGPEHYLAQDLFEQEQACVFRRHWILAGLRSQFSGRDAFVVRRIGGVPVVVQRIGGELRAFENICPHRQMALQTAYCGDRPLVCRYHGWSFDSAAIARIPREDALYRYPESERKSASLREFRLAEIGEFLFVNLSDSPLPIEKQFSAAFLAALREVSAHFDGEIIHARVRARHNWKLGFENVLDGNHVHHIHARTFGTAVPAPAPPPHAPQTAPKLCDLSGHLQTRFSNFKSADWHRHVQPLEPEAPPTYHNWIIWPNVNFVSIGGYSFSLHQFDPVSPDETDILMLLFLSRRREESRQSFYFSPAVLWHNIQAEKRILDEDIAALEQLQAGLHAGARPALLGAGDEPIARFLKVQAALMRGGS